MRRVAAVVVSLVMVATSCGGNSDAADATVALENLAENVVLGECESEFIGLAMTVVPDGWQCRLLNDPISGLVGFTLFNNAEPDGIEITISTPSPSGRPCDILVACDDVVPLEVGSTFDVEVVEVGVPIIYGVHKTVDAEVTVAVLGRLTHDDIAFITTILNGVEEI